MAESMRKPSSGVPIEAGRSAGSSDTTDPVDRGGLEVSPRMHTTVVGSVALGIGLTTLIVTATSTMLGQFFLVLLLIGGAAGAFVGFLSGVGLRDRTLDEPAYGTGVVMFCLFTSFIAGAALDAVGLSLLGCLTFVLWACTQVVGIVAASRILSTPASHRCPACGYPKRGATSGRCPECGAAHSGESPMPKP